MILKPGFFLIKESMDVFLDSFDTCDTEVFNQDLCHIRREEGRECWSKMNVLYAQVKKRKKNDIIAKFYRKQKKRRTPLFSYPLSVLTPKPSPNLPPAL